MRTRALLPVILGLAAASQLPAVVGPTTYTWSSTPTNGDTNVSANWVGGVTPFSDGTNTNIVFGSSTLTNLTLSAGFTTNSVTFTNTAPRYNFSSTGGSILSLGSGGIALQGTTSSFIDLSAGLNITLLANQTWDTGGNLSDKGLISGAASIIKTGNGSLTLGGQNTFSGGLTISSGTLSAGASSVKGASVTSGPAGTGTLTLTNGTALVNSSGSTLTLDNSITIAGSTGTPSGTANVTFGETGANNKLALTGAVTLASASPTFTVLGNVPVQFLGNISQNTSPTPLTIKGGGIAVFSGTNTYTGGTVINGTAVGFMTASSLPATGSISMSSNGYIGVGTSGLLSTVIGKISSPSTYSGSLGFESANPASPTTFSDTLALSTFGSSFRGLGTFSNAIYTGALTVTSGQDYKFGGGTGILTVNTTLAANGSSGLSVISSTATTGEDDHITVVLKGANNFTGNVTVTAASLIFDSALPPTTTFRLTEDGYIGYTENSGITNFAAFVAKVTGGSSTHDVDAIIGIDTNTGSARAVSETIDLSGFGTNGSNPSIFFGTATKVTLGSSSVIKPPSGGTLKIAGVDGGYLKIEAPLTTTNGVTALQVGNSEGEPGDVSYKGTIELTNTGSNYTGSTTLQSGALLVGASSTGTSGSVTTGPVGRGTLVVSGLNDAGFPTLAASASGVTLHNNISLAASTNTLLVGVPATSDQASAAFPLQAFVNNSLTLAGVISGSGALNVNGGGTLTLTATNTYSGGTTISSGTLQIGTDVTGLSPTSTTGSIAGNILDNANLTFSRSNASSYSGVISGSGNLTVTGGGTFTLSGLNTYTGSTAVNQASTLAVNTANTLPAATTVALSFGTLAVGASQAISALTGSTNGFITLASGQSLTLAGIASNLLAGSQFNGVISGAGSLVKNGANNLNLGGANTYTGGTTINAGTVTLSNASGSATGTGLVTVGASGTLNVSGGNAAGSLTGDIANSGTVAFARADDTTYAGGISGSGNVTKTGAGTLTLAGTNTLTGTLAINAGQVSVGSDTNLGSPTATLALNNGVLITTNSLTLASTRNISLGTLGSGSGFGTATNTTLTIPNAISGSGGLTKYDNGTLVLTGANTYAGGTTIVAGTLQIGNVTTTGSITGNVINNGTLSFMRSDDLTFGGVISGTGFVWQRYGGALTLTGNNTYTGGTKIDYGTMNLNSATALGTGNFQINGGNLGNSSGAALTLTNNNTQTWTSNFQFVGPNDLNLGTGSVALGGNISLYANTGTLTVGGVIGDGGNVYNLRKVGAGTLVLAGASTFTGGLTISEGVVSVATLANGLVASPIGSSSTAVNSLFIDSGGTFRYTGAAVSTDRLFRFGNSGTLEASGSGTLAFTNSGNLGVFGNAGLILSGTGTGTLAPRIGNATEYTTTLTKSGTGTWTLLNANTYTGATTINAGTLALGANNALASATSVNLTAAGATLDLGGTLNGFNSLTGVTGTQVLLGSGTLTTNSGNFAGVISGGGAVAKGNTGTLTLAGANTYTGGTIVNGGTVNVTGSLAPAGDVTVNGSGNFQLTTPATQTIRALSGNGTVTVGTGATLASNLPSSGTGSTATFAGTITGPGAFTKTGPGTLTVTGASTYTGPTTVASGTLVIGGTNALPTATQLALASSAAVQISADQTIAGFLGNTTGSNLLIDATKTLTIAFLAANTFTNYSGSIGLGSGSGTGTFAVTGATGGGDIAFLANAPGANIVTTHDDNSTIVIGSAAIPLPASGSLLFSGNTTQTLNNVISGGTVTNPVTLTFSAGNTTFTAANTYIGNTTINGGKFVVNNVSGSATGSGTVTVDSGGTIGGSGFISGPLVVGSGGGVSPGNSPGALGAGPTTFANGATFNFEINNTSGTPGTNWDILNITGGLTITATTRNPFVINLYSLDSSNNAGVLSNFNSAQAYSWQFVSTTTGITGFSAGAFQYNASQFQNSLGTGFFFVSQSGNNLLLNFTPVPEPSTWALLATGLGALLVVEVRRRRSR